MAGEREQDSVAAQQREADIKSGREAERMHILAKLHEDMSRLSRHLAQAYAEIARVEVEIAKLNVCPNEHGGAA